ncbi:centrosomal protein of 104 kDa isoform X1 [Anguilla anguilla]|uniref:centrosomal protein of 104 kDa isoform X1 n=2 Tax=Anguilla anguilla TaxID=7936 RepID=UPI0015B06365|nr:centrosomal protein of 104 kDa isoform X1 [Anguilla anguilla]
MWLLSNCGYGDEGGYSDKGYSFRMPHKIGFGVASSSSHEDNYSAKELMVHAPTVNGWRSARSCPYPQEITLQLVERSRIRKLQLLAHQYMISAKIEFHVGDSLPEGSSPHAADRLRRLGYVSLSDNEKTGFKARELKSVHVDAVGTYLRLTFHRNHANRCNLYNQVALVAINILGDPVDGKEMDTIPTRDQLIEQYLNSTQHEMALDGTYSGKCDSISPLDDLAFDMYQDPEVAQIVRRLDEKKQDAVRQERYELAKTLKQAMADLQKVGERLGRYEVEKRSAIEKEDYDTAKQKKDQMEEYRLKVYQQLEVHNLLDMSLIQRAAEPAAKERPVPAPSPSPPPSPEKRAQSPPEIAREKKTEKFKEQERVSADPPSPRRAQTPPTLPAASPEIPKISVSTLPYDERPLPALRKQQKLAEQPELPPEEPPDSAPSSRSVGVTGEPEPLTEKAMREASFPIAVYGEGLVAAAYSKTWSYREDALLAVCKKLSQAPAGTPKEDLRTMMRAAVFLARKAILDKVSSVFQASLKLLKMILTQFIPQHKLGRAEVAHCLEQTWPNLLAKAGDPAGRLRLAATSFIQEMALFKEVRSLQTIPTELVKPMKSSVPARLALSHVELTERLLAELGTDGSGFSLENVMQFSTGALEHSAAEVREKAVHIILAMYRQHRSAVLDFLPPNDANTRRNVLYKNIFDGFAKMDGRPAEPQAKALKRSVTRVVHKEKKEEIRTLQEQLAALKEISEKEKGKENSKGRQSSRPVKAGIKKIPPSKATVVQDVDQSPVANYLDRLCIFCGETDESFTEEGLDLHYWKHCPMLRRCDLCRQVVEISSLNEHLLEECESKGAFAKCPQCAEAVPRDQLVEHARSQACNPPATDRVSNHCPLCHDNFMPGEEAWKSHLMGREGCKQNARRTAALQRALQSQGKIGTTGATKLMPVGARGRPGPSASRIPAPKAGGGRANRPNPARR